MLDQQDFKCTIVNRALTSLHGGLLKNTRTEPIQVFNLILKVNK